MEKEKLEFKPINRGLGFHHLAEEPKKKSSNQIKNSASGPSVKKTFSEFNFGISHPATGATAAGRPDFSMMLDQRTTPMPIYQPQSPAAPKNNSTQKISGKPSILHASPSNALPNPRVLKFTSSEKPVGLPKLRASYGLNYSLKRFFAYLIDSVMNITLCGIAFILVLQQLEVPLSFSFIREFILTGGLFLIGFSWIMVLAQEIAFGTSLGKRFFNLAITGSNSALFLRAFFFIVSFGFFGLGILWALFDSDRRCWHDIIVETQPQEFLS